jgi:hypothetical protein
VKHHFKTLKIFEFALTPERTDGAESNPCCLAAEPLHVCILAKLKEAVGIQLQ